MVEVYRRRLEIAVARRKAAWQKPEPYYHRGYGQMFTRNVQQANDGCDFDFLAAKHGPTPEPEIH